MTHPKKVIQKAFWTDEIKNLEITIRHRGAPGDKKKICGKKITKVTKGGFWIGDTFIPFHRVIDVVSR